MHISLLGYIFLFASGTLAGLVDSIAGGGGIITIPALLAVGLPPHFALGTNKFQSSFGSLTASCNYMRNGEISLSRASRGIIATLIGAALGTLAVERINADLLQYIIPSLLIVILIYTLASPSLGETKRVSLLSEKVFYPVFGLILGAYDGFFGPGTGSFWAFAFVGILGYDFKTATGYTKVMNFASNLVSVLVFFLGGFVVIIPGLAMALGEIIGARLGSGLVIKKGARFVRPVFIAVVLATTLKIFYDRILIHLLQR